MRTAVMHPAPDAPPMSPCATVVPNRTVLPSTPEEAGLRIRSAPASIAGPLVSLGTETDPPFRDQ
jgi:hypothetical protein